MTVTAAGCAAPVVSLSVSGAGSLGASWTYDASGACAVSGFTVEHRAGTSGTWTSTSKAATATSHDITGLTAGTNHQARVTANLSASGADPLVSTAASATAISAPDAPTAVTAGTAAHDSLPLTWTLPAATTAKPRTAVVLSWAATADTTDSGSETLAAAATSGTATGLAVSTEYSITVTARNAAGDTAATAITATTAAEPLEVWFTSSGSLATTGTVLVTPRLVRTYDENGAVSGVRLFQQAATNKMASATCSMTSADTNNCPPGTLTSRTNIENVLIVSVTDKSPKWGQALDMDIVATAGAETANANYGYHMQVGGPAVPAVSVSAGNGAIAVGWTDPHDYLDHSVIGQNALLERPDSARNGYQMWHRAAGTDTWTESDWQSADTRTYTINNLTNGTNYQIRVRARNDNADNDDDTHLLGLASGACRFADFADPTDADQRTLCNATPAAASATAPGDPTFPATGAITVGNTQLIVSWTAPTSLGGADVHAYSIRHRLSTSTNDSDWVTAAVAGTITAYPIAGLTNSSTYTVQVQAHNAGGTSGWASTTGTPSS